MAEKKLDGPVRIYVPQGSLGVSLDPAEVEWALARKPHAIALDAGSTDSGASYLATGESKNPRRAVRNDLKLLMAAQKKARIPILIGTCGQAGGDLNVDWTKDIVLELARELDYAPRIAVLYSEQSHEVIRKKLKAGKITSLPPKGELDEATIDKCLHIVALMGPEPYFKALEAGADIILGGRGSDPAVIAAFALWKGAPAGPSWHAGKVAECGGQSTTQASGRFGVFIEIHDEGFDIDPVNPTASASVESISGHLLYENKDPWRLTEPGGELDVTKSEYHALDKRTVRVTGSVWHPRPYTMKLEGASGDLFQTIMVEGIADPNVLAEPQVFHDRLLSVLTARAVAVTDLAEDEFHISLRMYGWNGLTGVAPPPGTPSPREIGVVFVATAKTQELAHEIARACNPRFFHMAIRDGMEHPSYGLAFTPAYIDRGPAYEFQLNHVVHVDSPTELVRMEMIDLSARKEKTDA
jgi:hypothetical protein